MQKNIDDIKEINNSLVEYKKIRIYIFVHIETKIIKKLIIVEIIY